MGFIKSGVFCLAAALSAIVVSSAAGADVPDALYGCRRNADALMNVEMGMVAGRQVAIRFRAQYSGAMNEILVYFVYRAAGYFSGDGGQVAVQVRADDGTTNHFPSATVLATAPVITDPMDHFDRHISFSPKPVLEAGKIYHVVFSNPAPDPLNNWISLDNLYNAAATTNMQPGVADADMATLWKYGSSYSWAVKYSCTPIFCVSYEDGSVQGQGYLNAASSSALRTISGSSKVRQTIAPAAGVSVSSVAVRVRKTGGSGELTVRLENGDGTLIEQGSIPAASAGASMTWVVCPFGSVRTLEQGKTYNLVLSAAAGTTYETFPLQDGWEYGFRSGVFMEGKMESTSGGGWSGGNTDDMQFYFTRSADSNADLNANGLPDAWEVRNFGSTNSVNGAPQADWDGDGACNLAEYVAGTVPTNAGSVFRIQSGGSQAGGFGLTFDSLTGRLYSVKCVDDLLAPNWVTLTSNVAGTGGQVLVTDTNRAVRRFYRLGVSQQ